MLLDRLGHPMWQWDAEDGVPPLESLLGPRTGTPRRTGAEAEAILDLAVRARQRRIRPPMEQLLCRLASRGAFFLVFEGLPASDGAFRSSGPTASMASGMVFLPPSPAPSGSATAACRCDPRPWSPASAALPARLRRSPSAAGPELAGPFGDRLTFRIDQAEVDVAIERVEADHEGRILLCASLPPAGRAADHESDVILDPARSVTIAGFAGTRRFRDWESAITSRDNPAFFPSTVE